MNWTPYGTLAGIHTWISTDLAEPRYAATASVNPPAFTTRAGYESEYKALLGYMYSQLDKGNRHETK